MIGLIRVGVGAVLLLVYLRIGVASAWWIAGLLGVVGTGIVAVVQGRAENARWAALALALAVIAAGELRHAQTHTGKLLVALIVWIALSQIMQWLATATAADVPAPGARRARGKGKNRENHEPGPPAV